MGNLELATKLVELAVKHNLEELVVGETIVIRTRKVEPRINLDDLVKQTSDKFKATDEQILMNPHAGLEELYK